MAKIDIFQIVRLGENEEFFRLIQQVDIDQVNEFGENLLHEAIAYDNRDAALELIRRGIDVNHQSSKGLSPLHYAVSRNNLIITKALLDKKANLALQDLHGNQPLWTAILSPKVDYEIVRILMQHGADPDHVNKYGKSSLLLAKEMKDSELLSILQSSSPP